MNEKHRMLPHSAVQWAGLGVLVCALAALPLVVPAYYVGLATTAMIGAMLALSLHLLVGATGLVSLGHGAFYGLAAYTVFLVSPEGAAKPIWLTLPLAMLVAGSAALVVGVLSLRTRGFFFLMVTLAFGQMIFFVFHDTKLGGGTDGAYLAKPLISGFGLTLDPASLPRSKRSFPAYYVALVQLVLMYLLLAALLRSLFGRVLEGIRVNEHRMEAMGFDTTFFKLVAFVVAGMLAGAAGHMWSLHSGFVNPELVGWHKSAEALLMILLGGIGSLAGAVIGAFAFAALGEVAQLVTERKLLVEGLVVLAAVIVLRRGIMGLALPRRRAASQATADDAVPAAGARLPPHKEARLHG
ncbi:MAG: branched-chain amino acid ABC transporter permease [Hyphomicrobiaceae bacterium]|nr:branched-chain amino acid ABC transporter permease [Hyphomicrobiaceae bacterium]